MAEEVKYPKVILAKTLDSIHITNKNFKKTFKVQILEHFHDPLTQKTIVKKDDILTGKIINKDLKTGVLHIRFLIKNQVLYLYSADESKGLQTNLRIIKAKNSDIQNIGTIQSQYSDTVVAKYTLDPSIVKDSSFKGIILEDTKNDSTVIQNKRFFSFSAPESLPVILK